MKEVTSDGDKWRDERKQVKSEQPHTTEEITQFKNLKKVKLYRFQNGIVQCISVQFKTDITYLNFVTLIYFCVCYIDLSL